MVNEIYPKLLHMRTQNIYFSFLCITIFFLYSCTESNLDKALDFADENRAELEKVLEHYKDDPEKLQAAQFLIENMLYRYTKISDDISTFYKKADSVFKDTLIHDRYEYRLDTLMQNIRSDKVQTVYDLKSITSSYLISNIEQAFETRKYEWCKKLSFENFCEYVLPYRLGTSPLEDWRQIYSNYFQGTVDSALEVLKTQAYIPAVKHYDPDDPNDSIVKIYIDSIMHLGGPELSVAVRLIGRERVPVIHYPRSFKPESPPTLLLNTIVTSCKEWTQKGTYTLRTFGIPAACDYTPQWGNRSMGHEWSTVIVPDGSPIPFLIGEGYLAGHYYWFGVLPKVYRRTYKIQESSIIFQGGDKEIPEVFKDPYYTDVSHLYFDAVDVEIKLTIPPPEKKKFAYIMVFDNQKWQPIHWGKIKNRKVTFTGMSKDCAYMAAYFHNGRYYPASSPFTIKNDNTVNLLEPNLEETETVHLKRKYTDKKVTEWCQRMVGAQLQLATKADFSDAIIFTIDTVPEARFQTVPVNSDQRFKYFRYMAPEGCPGDIAELEVYDSEGNQIKGEIIGDETSFYFFASSDKFKAFDGDVLTFFESARKENVWIGLKFDKPTSISKIIYLPHNDDNFIRQDEVYELFYIKGNGQWESLGKQYGNKETQQLTYNAPRNSLFRLRNLTKGKEERIFTYENGEQVWW